MKTVTTSLLGLGLAFLSLNASAAYLFQAGEATCDQLQRSLEFNGKIMVHDFEGVHEYFASPDSCGGGFNPFKVATANYAYIPSSDQALCYVGYVCTFQGNGN